MFVMALASRYLLGGLFLVSGGSKVFKNQRFRAALQEYGFFPSWMISVAAPAVPLIELMLGVAVFALPGTWQGWVSALLLATLTAVLIIPIRQGRQIDCGCFVGSADQVTGWHLVLRNILLLGLSILVGVGGPGAGADLVTVLSAAMLAALATIGFSIAVQGMRLLTALATETVSKYPPDFF